MNPTPYLTFQGECRAAMTAYAEIFGGTLGQIMSATDAPDDFTAPEGKEDWVMHVGMDLPGGGQIFASDDLMGDTPPMAGVSLHMGFAELDRARAVFEALAEGGEVRSPFGPTFWTEGFGTLRDRWGINWMISNEAAEG